MNNCPTIKDSAEAFSYFMRSNRRDFDVANESLKAQIRLLWAQGLLTENAMQVLFQSITDIVASFIRTETRYYEMRNKLEEYELKGAK